MEENNEKDKNHFNLRYKRLPKNEYEELKENVKQNYKKDLYSVELRSKNEEIRKQERIREQLRSEQEIENLKANRALRDKYSFKAFKVVKKSLWGWAILLFIYGLVKLLTRHENGGFEIFSDHVLIAITTATTLNIYAGFLSLIRGLFPSIKVYRIKIILRIKLWKILRKSSGFLKKSSGFLRKKSVI